MKTEDLEIGSDYVVSPDWAWKRGYDYVVSPDWAWKRGYDDYVLERATVLETGVDRALASDEYRRYPRTKPDGIRVQILDADGTPRLNSENEPLQRVVRSAEIRMGWAEYVEARDASRKAHRDSVAETLRKNREDVVRIEEALGLSLSSATTPYFIRGLGDVNADGSQTTKVNLTINQIALLLEAAYENGENDD